jgi:cellulose synthase/poly-beta-1,6-N-acetylglucosamine synthase-like glycosyltransferase
LAGADLVVHGATIELTREGITYQTRPLARDDWYRSLLVRNVVGGTPMVACRRTWLDEAGGFREDLKALEDYELWIRMARAGARITVVPEPLTRCEYVTEHRSVSKHIANHHQALDAIRATYQADYDAFTPQQWREHHTWVEGMLAYKHVLNNQRREAARSYLQALQASRAPRYLVMSLLALSWPKGLYRLRSLIA